jgi:hypothetical protein
MDAIDPNYCTRYIIIYNQKVDCGGRGEGGGGGGGTATKLFCGDPLYSCCSIRGAVKHIITTLCFKFFFALKYKICCSGTGSLLSTSLVNPDPEPDSQGDKTFSRIRIRNRNSWFWIRIRLRIRNLSLTLEKSQKEAI